ncbi:hypothetical protein FEM03_17480 [Phragmitibacter flavus]|uniref:Fibronectin type-III domain-containing protein n=2 Tax=Phragmitibacter flavus TaxID=2576071 RepID=A0A5R8KBW7_9BACT|nr:hypothetical protein FEM03_17480 [Phragmitibacter flavus]
MMMSTLVHGDVKRRGEEAEKKNKNPIQVPEVRAVGANFIAGGRVEVELVAVVGTLRRVEFVIRDQPQFGSLSEVRPHPRDNNKAFIIYTHQGKDAPTADHFTYACRVDGGPFSAPGRATLTGQKFDPILKVRSQPMFNRIFAGGQIESKVMVENVGAAAFDGKLNWEAPFFGPPDLQVAPGQKLEFVVAFRPDKAGHYRWELPLQTNQDAESVLQFYGDSIPALTVSPGRMFLKWESETRERSAILTLANGRPDMMDVKLRLPKRLQGGDVVTIKPQGREDVRLWLAATDVAEFSEELVIEAAGVTERVLITAEAQPAQLRLVTPTDKWLNFGSVKQREEVEREFTIANHGGQDLLTTLALRPPFAVEELGQTIRLEPGQERRFLVKLDTRAAGKFDVNLEISGASQKAVIKMEAVVTAVALPGAAKAGPAKPNTVRPSVAEASRPKTETSLERPSVAAVSPQMPKAKAPPVAGGSGNPPPLDRKGLVSAMLAMRGMRVDKLEVNPNLEQVNEIQAHGMTQSSLILSWPQTKVKPASWRVEAASNGMKPEENLIVKFWQPISNWSPAEGGDADKISVNVNALRPGLQYEFRVVGVDQEGKVSEPSPSIMVSTLPAWRVPAWVWRVLVAGALGMVFYILFRVRRGDFEFEHKLGI